MTPEHMARLSASEVAGYRWPGDTVEHRAMRAAFLDGAAHTVTAEQSEAWAVEMDGAFFSLWLSEHAANRALEGYRRGTSAEWRVVPITITRSR